MTCDQIREQLGAYVDGEVSPSVQASVAQHLPCCASCACELESLRRVCRCLAPAAPTAPPAALWSAIDSKLAYECAARRNVTLFRWGRLVGIAACVLVSIGLGLLVSQRGFDLARPAQAATVDFRALLNDLATDARGAFDRFLEQYGAEATTPLDAKRYAAALNFELPDTLPGGFRLEAAYTLRFGDSPGAAARYARDGEFLGALFHPPVLKEHFGTHKEYACVIGDHRGHSVAVGQWRLVHLTDATTCHCVLSRLDPASELAAVMAAVAPHLTPGDEGQPHMHE